MRGLTDAEGNMLYKILGYGVLAGMIVGIPLSILVLTMSGRMMSYGMVVGYLLMLIALSLVFVAIKRHRDETLGGVIGFLPALGLGLGISAVAGIVYVVAWETVCALGKFDFATVYANAMIAEQRAKGVSGAALAGAIAEAEAFKVQYANPLFRLPMTFLEIFPVGVLVTLVSAALLRNPRFLPAPRTTEDRVAEEARAA
jgi:hypothetical protein